MITGAAIAASLPASQFLASPAYAAGKDPVPGTNPLSATVREAVRKAEARSRRVMTGKPSRNGWEMERVTDDGGRIFTRPVPGTPLAGIAVRMGDVETVLVHVVRRFHYEVEELRKGDAIGWRSPGTVRKGLPESNQASGTAVQIRPGAYPADTRGGFFPQQRLLIQDILTELNGVIRWGGNDPNPDESLFYTAPQRPPPHHHGTPRPPLEQHTGPGRGCIGRRDGFTPDELNNRAHCKAPPSPSPQRPGGPPTRRPFTTSNATVGAATP